MAIVRNIQNKCLYEYLGEDRYRNLVTGKEGTVTPEQAKDILKINLDATVLLEEYPLIKELINKLQLRCDGNENKKT